MGLAATSLKGIHKNEYYGVRYTPTFVSRERLYLIGSIALMAISIPFSHPSFSAARQLINAYPIAHYVGTSLIGLNGIVGLIIGIALPLITYPLLMQHLSAFEHSLNLNRTMTLRVMRNLVKTSFYRNIPDALRLRLFGNMSDIQQYAILTYGLWPWERSQYQKNTVLKYDGCVLSARYQIENGLKQIGDVYPLERFEKDYSLPDDISTTTRNLFKDAVNGKVALYEPDQLPRLYQLSLDTGFTAFTKILESQIEDSYPLLELRDAALLHALVKNTTIQLTLRLFLSDSLSAYNSDTGELWKEALQAFAILVPQARSYDVDGNSNPALENLVMQYAHFLVGSLIGKDNFGNNFGDKIHLIDQIREITHPMTRSLCVDYIIQSIPEPTATGKINNLDEIPPYMQFIFRKCFNWSDSDKIIKGTSYFNLIRLLHSFLPPAQTIADIPSSSDDSERKEPASKADPENSNNYYTILGATQKDSKSEITKKWRDLLRIWHPDKNKNNEENATEVSKKINTAYRVLSDAGARAAYDSALQSSGAYNDSKLESPSEFFNLQNESLFSPDPAGAARLRIYSYIRTHYGQAQADILLAQRP